MNISLTHPAWLVILLTAFAFTTTTAVAQRSIELSGGLGYTAVDVESWAGRAPNDWDQFMHQIYLQAFLFEMGPVTVGAEVGYQYFFWHEVRIPFGQTTLFRQRDSEAYRLMATGRFRLAGGLFADLGVGAYFFEDWTDYGIMGALGRRFALGPRLSLPVKLRSALVLDADAPLLPVGLSVGVAYDL